MPQYSVLCGIQDQDTGVEILAPDIKKHPSTDARFEGSIPDHRIPLASLSPIAIQHGNVLVLCLTLLDTPLDSAVLPYKTLIINCCKQILSQKKEKTANFITSFYFKIINDLYKLQIFIMNKIVPKLIRDTIIVRNWAVLSNYNIIRCANHSQVVKSWLEENYEKDLSQRPQHFAFPQKPEKFVNHIQQNYKTMTVEDTIQTLDILYGICNKDRSHYIDLKKVQGFEHICNAILKRATSLNTYDTIRMLRISRFFGIPCDSLLVRTLLQLLRASLNKLTIGQIMIIYNVLYDSRDLPQTKALCSALIAVFKQQAEIELNSESTNLLRVLRFCSTIDDTKTKQHIIEILIKNQNQINPQYAVDIFYALYTLPELNLSSRQLLSRIKSIIIKNAEILSFKDIGTLLYCIYQKCKNSEMEFYDTELVTTLSTIVSNSEATFHDKLKVLKLLNLMHFGSPSLLNSISKCLESENTLKMCLGHHLQEFVKGLVVANYKPCNWETVEKVLHDVVANLDYSINNKASIAFNLLSLDSYHPELLKQVFSLYNRIPNVTQKTELTMLRLHWCVKLLYPDYEGTMLDENKLNIINHIPIEHESNQDLKESLLEIVGDVKYIRSGLKTKFGMFIDHVVLIKSMDSSPINVDTYDNVTFVEDLLPLPECVKLLFLALPEEAYSINERTTLPTVQMLLKAIKTLPGFQTFVADPYLWQNLSRKSKMLQLQEAIKLNDSSNNSSN